MVDEQIAEAYRQIAQARYYHNNRRVPWPTWAVAKLADVAETAEPAAPEKPVSAKRGWIELGLKED